MKYANALIAAERVKESIINMQNRAADVIVDGCNVNLPRFDYQAYPTLTKFHVDQKANVKIVIGPYGSGKSSGLTVEILRHAYEMPTCLDGVRRARWLIVRNTYDELKSTSLKMWEEWCEDVGNVHRNMQPPITFTHDYRDNRGHVHLEVIFLALNRDEQLRKLGSYNITCAYLNELRELPRTVLEHISDRTGRYPAQRLIQNKPFWHGVIADTNAPKLTHWIVDLESNPIIKYTDQEGKERELITRIYHQPPALLQDEMGKWVINPEAENVKNLPGEYDYYFKMLQHGDDYVRVYAQGKYGSIRSGTPVYKNYNDDLHSVANLPVLPGVPIILGVDYGRICPAILCCQYAANQLRVIKEFLGDNQFIRDLANEQLIPWLIVNCPKKIVNNKQVMDCRGFDDASQTDDGRSQLRKLDLDIRAARSNRIEPRLASVGWLLGRINSVGKASIVISREGCPRLRDGFLGEYKYQEIKSSVNKEAKDEPDKVHPYSDIHDALQYVSMEYVAIEEITPKKVQYQASKHETMWI
jgi:hypothetical protein